MSKNLSLDDLSFFEVHTATAGNALNETGNVLNNGISVLSLNTSSHVPSALVNEEDDDFGDFVQFEPSNPEANSSISNATLSLSSQPVLPGFFQATPDKASLPLTSQISPLKASLPSSSRITSSVPSVPSVGESSFSQKLQKVSPLNSQPSLLSSSPSLPKADIIDISVPKQIPSIESSAKDLGSTPSNLKFGQTSHSGTVSSADLWTGVLGARSGPSIEKSIPSLMPEILLDNKHYSNGLHKVPLPSLNSSRLQQQKNISVPRPTRPITSNSLNKNVSDNSDSFAPPPSIEIEDLLDLTTSSQMHSPSDIVTTVTDQEEQLWNDDDDDDFSDFATANPIPTPDILLSMMSENVLPSANKLLNSLKPLSYSLKKRVVSHPNTKTFLTGYLEAVNIASRIMAGRNRRVLTLSQKSQADRESRRLESIWSSLSTRLESIMSSPVTTLVLNAKLVFPEKVSGSTCSVCGLSKVEIVKGQSKPIWIDKGSLIGHKTCINWWNNRSVFGLS